MSEDAAGRMMPPNQKIRKRHIPKRKRAKGKIPNREEPWYGYTWTSDKCVDGVPTNCKWYQCQQCGHVHQSNPGCPECGADVDEQLYCHIPEKKHRSYKTFQVRMSIEDHNQLRRRMREGGFVSASDCVRDALGMEVRADPFVSRQVNALRLETIERKRRERESEGKTPPGEPIECPCCGWVSDEVMPCPRQSEPPADCPGSAGGS